MTSGSDSSVLKGEENSKQRTFEKSLRQERAWYVLETQRIPVSLEGAEGLEKGAG